MSVVVKLEHTFDHNKLLDEFLSCQPNKIMPGQYSTMEVFNEHYSQAVVDNCPYTINVCEKIKELKLHYNFVLFRLLQPHTTLGWHTDQDCESISYHIPVTTNEACFYIYDVELHFLQTPGRLYKVRNDDMHTFVNAGTSPRLHLHFLYDNGGQYRDRRFLG
jgi:hypothetical protein